MILDEIIEKRKIQLEREKQNIPDEKMKQLALEANFPKRGFKEALCKNGLSVIAEVKKASPSKGVIQPDFNPVLTAAAYEKCGANAISCLTEEHYFQGSARYLSDIRKTVNIPILRKDFIFDEYQIYEAKAIGADAVLLIAAVLDDDMLKKLYGTAKNLGLDVLFEAHSENEVKQLLRVGAEIIGINNRNLKTFEVSLETTKRLAEYVPDGTVLVCESGIKNNADMRYAAECGADAVLIGETLMRSGVDGISHCMEALREGTV